MLERRKFLGGTAALVAGASLFTFTGCVLQSKNVSDPWQYVADLRTRIKIPVFPERDFDIASFGAVGDGEKDCTTSINDAVRACSKAGGGRVVVAAGTYKTGPIHLLSNVNLHLKDGATLSFYNEPERYLPTVFTRWEGTELMNYSPLIYAYKQVNIAVTGKGTLDGGGDKTHWWPWKGKKYGHKNDEQNRDALIAMSDKGVPPEQRIIEGKSYLRPSFIQPYDCHNVLIEGIKVRKGPFWNIHPVLCTNVTVRNLDINTHGPNNDGCNPESCKGVLIENCTFDVGDDCIAIKSGRNTDGRRLATPCEDIIIANCHMKDGHGGVVVGSEMSGGVRNVFAEDCIMDSPDLWYALRIKTNSLRGGFVEGIHMRNVEIGTIGKAAFRINFHYQKGDVGNFVPRVSNVTVSNVTGKNVKQVLSMRGYERSPINGVKITDCKFSNVQKADVVENVKNLVMDNVSSDFYS
ncbi:MAG: glycoside hydrolase family 28 protein [Colwellia sp.]|nr:glycoside hydrolase family 28 protein [Colwellia sp.]